MDQTDAGIALVVEGIKTDVNMINLILYGA